MLTARSNLLYGDHTLLYTIQLVIDFCTSHTLPSTVALTSQNPHHRFCIFHVQFNIDPLITQLRFVGALGGYSTSR